MYASFGLFIDGAWRGGGGRGHRAGGEPGHREAARRGAGRRPRADTEAAIAARRAAASPHGGRRPAFERADALHAIADEMIRRKDEAARMISAETGKPLAQAEREWGLSADQFRWYAEEARRIYGRIVESRVPGGRFEVTREPMGIVAAFTAWNFPAALLARKVAPALAAGCSVVVRPSSQTPGVAMVLVDCCRAGDLPAGAVNLVIGPTAATYAPIMASPRGAQGVADRLDPRRPADDPRRRGDHEEGDDGARRQRAAHRLRRRRPRGGARRLGADQVRQRRAGLRDRRTGSSCTRACTTPSSTASPPAPRP